MPFVEVQDRNDLRIGSFVKLEGSWFSHPFPTNTFAIKSSEDLATIQGLNNVTILYDPDSGTHEDDGGSDEGISPLQGGGDGEVDAESHDSSPSGTDPDENTGVIPESSLSEIIDRRQEYQDFQNHLRKVEGAYQKTLAQGNELFRQVSGRRPAGLKTADDMISHIVQMLNNPKATMSLLDMVGSNGLAWGLSEHALNVCTLSVLIGRQMNLDVDVLGELGRGALFHDVGYRALPMKVRFGSSGMKVQADPELGNLHPELGGQLMSSFLQVGPELLNMITQHHERLDGSGYPQGVKADALSPLTKILMVADHFDELCNAPDPQSSLSPHAALSRLYRHVVEKGEEARFCPHVVQALVQAIGVYPPGSLVELTDGFWGIVTSVNIHEPTRPVVLLYAPWLCRNDGMMVNLVHRPELEIKKAVHMKDVPQQVLAYLSPRRMAMFVHATEPTTMAFNSNPRRRSKKPRVF